MRSDDVKYELSKAGHFCANSEICGDFPCGFIADPECASAIVLLIIGLLQHFLASDDDGYDTPHL